MSNYFNLNPDNFKRWMKSQSDFEASINRSLIGMNAETKFSGKRILNKINIEEGRKNKVLKDFTDNGGIIKEIDGDEYLIEVSSGSFYINKRYIIV